MDNKIDNPVSAYLKNKEHFKFNKLLFYKQTLQNNFN